MATISGLTFPRNRSRLPKTPFEHNLAHGSANGFSYARIGRQVAIASHQLVEAFAKSADRSGSAAIGAYLMWVFTIRGQKLRQRC
jgi:hypothetical protein